MCSLKSGHQQLCRVTQAKSSEGLLAPLSPQTAKPSVVREEHGSVNLLSSEANEGVPGGLRTKAVAVEDNRHGQAR